MLLVRCSTLLGGARRPGTAEINLLPFGYGHELVKGSSSDSDSDSGVGGFLAVTLCFDERGSVATGGGGDGPAGAAALALPPFFGLAGAGAVESVLDCILLRKRLFIGSAGLPVFGYLGGHLKISTG
jgi:hypothetical protein